MDIQRVTGLIFKKQNNVRADNAKLETLGGKDQARSAYEARLRDGKDDVLIKDKKSDNYYLLSGDRIDFTTIGQGNKVKLGRTEGEVVALNDEGHQSHTVSRSEGSLWWKKDFAARMLGAKVETVTEKSALKALDDRISRDGLDNLVIRDSKSDNTFLVSAHSIDFTTVGVGNKVKIGQTEGEVTKIDDER